MELMTVNPTEYGLESTKAKEISELFIPMLDKMKDLEEDYNDIIKKDITEEVCEEAKKLRNKYVKVRTGTAEVHKKLKEFYLKGGRFVDGWKNAQIMASKGNEDKLKEIEKHYENIEKERIQTVQASRAKDLMKYGVNPIPDDLGDMSEKFWGIFLSGAKTNHELLLKTREEAAQKAKEEEEKVKAERQRVYKENEKLRAEAAEKEAERKKELEFQRFREAELHAENRRVQAENQAKLKKEAEERKKLEDKIKAQKEAELKAKEEEEARIQADLNKGDSEKVQDLLKDLAELKSKYEFKSNVNKQMYTEVKSILDEGIRCANFK